MSIVRSSSEFDAVPAGLSHGRRRHLALLGLRRIGKTLLLDEVRHRHPDAAIVYLALDEVVATPEDFARALATQTLQAASGAVGPFASVGATNQSLHETASVLHPRASTVVDDVIRLLEGGGSYGALLTAVFRLPAEVSSALDLPVLVMLDEFQDIVRLRVFANTDNLLGAVRAAVDRRGKVAFVVSGSRVTVMRELLSGGESPLFTRFEQFELRPFILSATHDLAARVWGAADLTFDPDSSTRLHRLTGGWPFLRSCRRCPGCPDRPGR